MDEKNLVIDDDFIIPPTSDTGFKFLFGNPQRKNLLINLLRSILKNDDIIDIEYINNELQGDNVKSKLGILDVHVILSNNQEIDIEIQRLKRDDMENRVLFYLSRMYSTQENVGKDYSVYRKCISINILGYKAIENKDYHNIYNFRNEKGELLTDTLEIHYIELPKVTNECEHDKLYYWMKFLKSETKEELKIMSNELKELREAYDCVVAASKDREAYLRYTREQMAEMDRISDIRNARQEGMAKGIKEGMAKGRAEGKAEGIEEGMVKGKAEGKLDATIFIARKLKDMNLSYNDISTSTGLSIEDIEKL